MIELGTAGVVASLHLECVGEPSPEVDDRSQEPLHIPGQRSTGQSSLSTEYKHCSLDFISFSSDSVCKRYLYPLLPPAGPSLALNDRFVGLKIGLMFHGVKVSFLLEVKGKQVFTFSLLVKSLKRSDEFANLYPRIWLTYLSVLPCVCVMEGRFLDPMRHLRHFTWTKTPLYSLTCYMVLEDLTNGPDDGHGGILGDGDISRVAEVAEGLPVGDLGHPVLLGAGVELGAVDT